MHNFLRKIVFFLNSNCKAHHEVASYLSDKRTTIKTHEMIYKKKSDFSK